MTKVLFDAASTVGADVLDLEQVVVRGHLTLSVLLSPGLDENVLVDRLTRAGSRLGMRVDLVSGRGDNAPRRTGRAAVVVMGAPLETHHVAAVAAAIAEHGANIDRIRRLSRYPVTTVELDVSGADVSDLRQDLAMVSHRVGADIAVAPAGLARRGGRLVVMDVDSTLIQDEVIELLAEHAGRAAEVAAVTEAAMRGELDFAQSLHARVATLAGLPASVLDEVRDAVRLTPGARTLVRTLKRLGFTVGVVSGGFVEVVEPIAERARHRPRACQPPGGGRRPCSPVGWSATWSTGPGRRLRCASSPPWRGCRSPGPSPSATVPTTSTCWPWPGWVSRSTPSRWCAARRTPPSPCPTWMPCCSCSASPARRSRTPTPTTTPPLG